jgi:hypothetical protein
MREAPASDEAHFVAVDGGLTGGDTLGRARGVPDPDVRRLGALTPIDMVRDYGRARQVSVKGRHPQHGLKRVDSSTSGAP